MHCFCVFFLSFPIFPTCFSLENRYTALHSTQFFFSQFAARDTRKLLSDIFVEIKQKLAPLESSPTFPTIFLYSFAFLFFYFVKTHFSRIPAKILAPTIFHCFCPNHFINESLTMLSFQVFFSVSGNFDFSQISVWYRTHFLFSGKIARFSQFAFFLQPTFLSFFAVPCSYWLELLEEDCKILTPSIIFRSQTTKFSLSSTK